MGERVRCMGIAEGEYGKSRVCGCRAGAYEVADRTVDGG